MPREDLLDTSLDDRLPEQESQARISLDDNSQEIAHLVCCRKPVWDVAFCGMPSDHINLDAEVICTMCIEVVEGLSQGCLSTRPGGVPSTARPARRRTRSCGGSSVR